MTQHADQRTLRRDRRAAVLAAVDAQREAEPLDLLDRLVRIPSVGGSAGRVRDPARDGRRPARRRLRRRALGRSTSPSSPPTPTSPAWRSSGTRPTASSRRCPGTRPTSAAACSSTATPTSCRRATSTQWTGDPYELRRVERDGRDLLLGRGTCDMKAGLVASIVAARALRAAGVRLAGDLTIAPVVGEEDGGLGTFALLRRGVTRRRLRDPRADRPRRRARERRRADVPAAHAGPSRARLAAYRGGERDRQARADPRTRSRPSSRGATPTCTRSCAAGALAYPLSIGTVHAGDWASTVPDLLVAEGRLGVALGESVADARAELEAAVAELCAGDPFLREQPDRRAVVGRPVRARLERRRRARRAGARAPHPRHARRARRRRSTALPTAATCGCWRRTSRCCSTAPATPARRTPPTRACPSRTSTPPPGPSPSSTSSTAASL